MTYFTLDNKRITKAYFVLCVLTLAIDIIRLARSGRLVIVVLFTANEGDSTLLNVNGQPFSHILISCHCKRWEVLDWQGLLGVASFR